MDYKQLDAWKESMNLVQLVYELTQSFPDEEKFGLVSQLRRASVSIPSNIAEGQSRNSNTKQKFK
jgi:four helix bundle protein